MVRWKETPALGTLLINLQWEADWLEWDRLHLSEDYLC